MSEIEIAFQNGEQTPETIAVEPQELIDADWQLGWE
jgi:hypothetical protein